MRHDSDAPRSTPAGRALLATLVVLPLAAMSALALLDEPWEQSREQPADEVERVAAEERPERASAERRTEHAVSRSRLDAEPEPVELAKRVTLIVRGTATKVETEAATVAELLEALDLETSDDDRVRPAPATPLASGAKVVVEVVDVETRVDTEAIAHETVRRETSERERGEEVVVQEGRDGKVETTIERVLVDGFEESETVVDESVTDPVSRVVEVGTAAPPEPEPQQSSSSGSGGDGVWDRLAECESNGNWSANTGNGFYGGLQFMKATWDSVGGQEFAEYPHQASRQQQITAGKRLQQRSGWGQWPHCSSLLGLR